VAAIHWVGFGRRVSNIIAICQPTETCGQIALLALDGSLGHVTEVLSGDQYQPLSTSSPHQIWSAAMVISPLLRGNVRAFQRR